MDPELRGAYAPGMTKTSTEPDADDTRSPPRHHKSHDVPMQTPPRQHGTHDAPMKPGRRPGC